MTPAEKLDYEKRIEEYAADIFYLGYDAGVRKDREDAYNSFLSFTKDIIDLFREREQRHEEPRHEESAAAVR